MKKIILMLAIVAGTHLSTHAQISAAEAKAAYMLAEENYGKGDFKATLDYLQQAKAALGGTNCKLIYLQIIATRQLYAKSSSLPDMILPVIAEFEQAPDYKDFNEDKILEITKIKLAMKIEQKTLREKAEKERLAREAEELANKALENALNKILSRYPPLGLTAEQLEAAHPELNAKKWKSNKLYSTVLSPSFIDYDFHRERYPFGRLDKDVDYRNQVVSMQYQPLDGLQKTYSFVGILVYTDKNINSGSAPSALAEADAIIERYRKELGTPTIPLDADDKDAHFTVYRWELKDKRIDLCKQYYPRGTQPVVKLFEEIRRAK